MSRRVLVTGSTGKIGAAISEILLEQEFDLILGGRNLQKLETLQKQLAQKFPKSNIEIFLADFRSAESLRSATKNIQGPLLALVNNAAETPRQKVITEEGLECQFAVNILGYHRMISLCLDKISQGGRIVNVASYWAGNLDLTDLQFERRPYDNGVAYRQSKQADRMLTISWAEKLSSRNITVNSCHPGDVNSRLSNDLGFGGSQSPREGADTPAWLVYSDAVDGVTGHYFSERKARHEPFAKPREDIDTLFAICEREAFRE